MEDDLGAGQGSTRISVAVGGEALGNFETSQFLGMGGGGQGCNSGVSHGTPEWEDMRSSPPKG